MTKKPDQVVLFNREPCQEIHLADLEEELFVSCEPLAGNLLENFRRKNGPGFAISSGKIESILFSTKRTGHIEGYKANFNGHGILSAPRNEIRVDPRGLALIKQHVVEQHGIELC